jgi:hypothetical protein
MVEGTTLGVVTTAGEKYLLTSLLANGVFRSSLLHGLPVTGLLLDILSRCGEVSKTLQEPKNGR